jgi:hypothetical protein
MIPGHSSRAIERGLAGGFFAATLATTLLVAENSFVPLQRPLTFGLVFWAWYAAFGLAAGLVLGSAAALLARAPAWCARALLAVPAAAILVVALLWNGGTLATVFQLQGPGRYRLLLPVAAAGAALGLAAVAVLPIARRAMLRVVTALILGAGLGEPAWRRLASEPSRDSPRTPRCWC